MSSQESPIYCGCLVSQPHHLTPQVYFTYWRKDENLL